MYRYLRSISYSLRSIPIYIELVKVFTKSLLQQYHYSTPT